MTFADPTEITLVRITSASTRDVKNGIKNERRLLLSQDV